MRHRLVITVLLISLTALVFQSFIRKSYSDVKNISMTNVNYTLNQPDEVHELPESLIEISGLTDFSDTKIACIEDERGIIFIYNILTREIDQSFKFAENADFEGLTRVDDVIYALSSEGTLYETKIVKGKTVTEVYKLDLPSADNEGLCYDEKENRLLISPKSKLGKGPEFKDIQAVYAFDLKKRKLLPEPIFYFNISDIYSFATKNNLPFHKSVKKNGELNNRHNFRPSSIAVHPKTDDIYIISADDRCLVVFDKKGKIIGFSALDSELFSKPEGITFLNDNTMLITNEGVANHPTLLVFKSK